ncbi:uncharacterized protein [Ranitomeya imitator]|uniref:uncharacterized protein isoform X2 n=1 Tax=Ranitomeya imitator TaxID=111125 RepID=UPI0037E8A4E0
MFSQEAEAAEGLSEGEGMGGETQRAGAQSSSQHAPDSDGEGSGLYVDRLIEEVREREPLWNMADRSHADQFVTHLLWEQICDNIVANWEDLDPRQQTRERERVMKRCRSLRDRFKREFNKEMQAPSGSRGRRRPQYKYSRALSFLRETMLRRSTFCSTREPASTLDPSGAIPQKSTLWATSVDPTPLTPRLALPSLPVPLPHPHQHPPVLEHHCRLCYMKLLVMS